jgi:hypothetical protein
MYLRQERINKELRIRVGDIEWLQLSEYHKNLKSVDLNQQFIPRAMSNSGVKNKKDDLDEDVANLEKDIEEMDKILQDTIDTTDDDGISEMILQMINKHEDKTVLDDNLENVISTGSLQNEHNTNDNDDTDHSVLNKDIDIKNIEETILSTIDNTDDLESSTSEIANNLSNLHDTEWIEESYTMNELRDLCKQNNIQCKGTKRHVIKTLLEKSIDIPKKNTQSYLSK